MFWREENFPARFDEAFARVTQHNVALEKASMKEAQHAARLR